MEIVDGTQRILTLVRFLTGSLMRMYRPRTYCELLEALEKQIDAVVIDPSPVSLNSLLLKIKILKDALKRGYGAVD